MEKKELKYYIKNYRKVEQAIATGEKEIIVGRDRSPQRKELPEWTKKLKEYIHEVMEKERDEVVKKVIRESIIFGKRDREVMMKLPISEGNYYHIKQMIVEKIYELYIYDGYLKRDEILSEGITE